MNPTPPSPASIPPASRHLLETLRATRDASAARPFAERREAVLEALRRELDALPAEAASSALDGMRDLLTSEARDREQRVVELASALERASAETRALAAERDRLEAERARIEVERDRLAKAAAEASAAISQVTEARTRVEELEREITHVAQVREKEMGARRTLEQEIARLKAKLEETEKSAAADAARTRAHAIPPVPPPTPPTAPVPPRSTSPASEATPFDRLRAALRRTADADEVMAEPGDLGPEDFRLLRLSQEVLKFALDYDRGIQAFLMGLSIEHQLDTRQIERQEELVRRRFIDCLDNREGSLARLHESLDRNRRFILHLNEAYTRAIPEGVRTIARELDPQTVLEGTRGRFGMKDHAEALRLLGEKAQQVAETPADELLLKYFVPAIQRTLAARGSS